MLLRHTHTHTFKEPENKLGGRSIKHVNDKVLYDVNICSHSISAVQTACLTRFPQDHLLRWPSHFQGLTLVPPPNTNWYVNYISHEQAQVRGGNTLLQGWSSSAHPRTTYFDTDLSDGGTCGDTFRKWGGRETEFTRKLLLQTIPYAKSTAEWHGNRPW